MIEAKVHDALMRAGAKQENRVALEEPAITYQQCDIQPGQLRNDLQEARTKVANIPRWLLSFQWLLGCAITTDVAIIFRIFVT